MKITTILREDERECRSCLEIKVDNKSVFRVYDGEPEDNSLNRNFSEVASIPRLMRMAYDAGKRGEEISFENVEKKWEDEDDE